MKASLFGLLIAVLPTLTLPASVSAQAGMSKNYDALLERIPSQANVLMLFDVQGLLDSPMGKRDNWRAMAAQNRPNPLGLNGHATYGAVAMGMDVASMNERWKLGMVQLKGASPNLEVLASREGGYVEDVAGMPVAFTPRGINLFRLTDNLVGFVSSADRQGLVTWIETTLSRPKKYAPGFADRALFKANGGSQVVLAVNLDHVVSPVGIEPWLNAMPQVKKTFSEPKLLAPRLASVKSAYLAVKVGQTIEGEIKVEFGKTLEGTSPILRAVVMQTVEDLGVDLPELKTWRIGLDSKNQTIEMEGRLSLDSLRKICSIASLPKFSGATGDAIASTAAGKADATPKYVSSEADALSASQGYFRAVTGIVASLKSTDRPTYRATKSWYDRYAKQIDELPILGVDKDLLDWGGIVSRTLREMSTGINYYAQNQSYTLAAQPNGVYAGYDYYYVGSKSYDQAVIKRQSDAAMSVDLDKKWQLIEISTADMRRKMVEKYKVDF